MYCFRCGRKLPGREINCPDCDTPKKKRHRRHKRMILGLFIFLSGAFAGSIFDTYLFKGEAWKHSFLNEFINKVKGEDNSANSAVNTSTGVTVEMKYSNPVPTTSETDKTQELKKVQEALFPTEEYNNQSTNVVTANNLPTTNQEDNVRVAEVKEDLKPIDGVPAEISDVLSAAPQNSVTEPNSETVVDNPNPIDDVVIVEETEQGSDVAQDASESASLYTEAAPVEETEQVVEQTTAPEGHLVYKSVSLLESASADSYHGFISKDGKELVFASNRYDYNGKPTFQCFIKSPSESAKAERVFEWKGNVWTPELTPDGNMIIFSSDSSKPEHIFLYDRKSGNSMALTSGTSKNMMPSISPDGKRVAFVSNRGDGKNNIWIMDLFNKNKIIQVTKSATDDREPRWTPDGKSIIFTRIVEKMKVSNIMKVDVDPVGEPVALVSGNTRNWMASVSPDNKLLAFTRSLNAGGSKNVIVLQDLSSGKEEVMSFPGIYESFRPVWNANGSGLVFHVSKKNGKCLYQANFVRE